MYKEYSRALRTLFELRLKETFPEYSRYKGKSEWLSSGERAYRSEVHSGLYVWIILMPSDRDTQVFAIEVGWSYGAEFPSDLDCRPSIESIPEALHPSGHFIRLSSLWDKWSSHWEILPEHQIIVSRPKTDAIAEERVLPHVDDVIRRLQQHWQPFTEQLRASAATKTVESTGTSTDQ